MKKDWSKAKKMQVRMGVNSPSSSPPEGRRLDTNGIYDKNMDSMRCVLYLHGGTI